jgi:hypothetical protein
MARGGRRTPKNPAPVSGPGALSRRTDGAAPQQSEAGGRPYGERAKLEALESAAPTAPAPRSSPQGGAAPPIPVPNAFGPTTRPYEDPTAGAMSPLTNPVAQNPQAALRVMYSKFPHPAIARLIDWSAWGSHPPR